MKIFKGVYGYTLLRAGFKKLYPMHFREGVRVRVIKK